MKLKKMKKKNEKTFLNLEIYIRIVAKLRIFLDIPSRG